MCVCVFVFKRGSVLVILMWVCVRVRAVFCWTAAGRQAGEPICGVFSLTACGCTVNEGNRKKEAGYKENTKREGFQILQKRKGKTGLSSSPFVSLQDESGHWTTCKRSFACWSKLACFKWPICVQTDVLFWLCALPTSVYCVCVYDICILSHLYVFMEGSNWVVQDRAQHRREPAGVIEGWAVCLWEQEPQNKTKVVGVERLSDCGRGREQESKGEKDTSVFPKRDRGEIQTSLEDTSPAFIQSRRKGGAGGRTRRGMGNKALGALSSHLAQCTLSEMGSLKKFFFFYRSRL